MLSAVCRLGLDRPKPLSGWPPGESTSFNAATAGAAEERQAPADRQARAPRGEEEAHHQPHEGHGDRGVTEIGDKMPDRLQSMIPRFPGPVGTARLGARRAMLNFRISLQFGPAGGHRLAG